MSHFEFTTDFVVAVCDVAIQETKATLSKHRTPWFVVSKKEEQLTSLLKRATDLRNVSIISIGETVQLSLEDGLFIHDCCVNFNISFDD